MKKTASIQKTPKKSYHHGDLRLDLLRVVGDLVETHGPDGFSISEAARRAGVSSGAPYKHFKDKRELMTALVCDAMGRLKNDMQQARDSHPKGSLESISATGQAYVDFARKQPGLFRMMFSLTEGHDKSEPLLETGAATFGVVHHAVADHLNLAITDPVVAAKSYELWAFVHGHSFLGIDKKMSVAGDQSSDWALLMDVARALMAKQASTEPA